MKKIIILILIVLFTIVGFTFYVTTKKENKITQEFIQCVEEKYNVKYKTGNSFQDEKTKESIIIFNCEK